MQPSILIAGIGNIFLGDDGFGCDVVRQLALRPQPDNVRIHDFGTRSLDLAFALLDPYDLVILVDAANLKTSPGSVYLIEPEVDDVCTTSEAHVMDPTKVLALARSMGAPLKRVLLVGCQPASFSPRDGDDGLTEVVRAAVPSAIAMVESIVLETCTNFQSL
jgi:hydrogenase maturation protease